MTSLSPRLQAVVERVLPGQPVADIGTDHGALACALIREDRVPRAIAVDVATGPVGRAQDAVHRAGLGARISVRLGDGLGPLGPGEVGTVVLCGMGGATIIRILEAGRDKLGAVARLVLSPHTAAPALRRSLVAWGWTDVDGCLVEDRGHVYSVAAWERGSARWSEADYRWGRHVRARPDPLLAAQLERERVRLGAAHAAAQSGREPGDPEVEALALALGQLDRELVRLGCYSSSSSATRGAQLNSPSRSSEGVAVDSGLVE